MPRELKCESCGIVVLRLAAGSEVRRGVVVWCKKCHNRTANDDVYDKKQTKTSCYDTDLIMNMLRGFGTNGAA